MKKNWYEQIGRLKMEVEWLEGISKPQFALQAVFLPAGLRREILPYPPICRRFCSLPAETKILAFVIKASFETPARQIRRELEKAAKKPSKDGMPR